MSFSLSTSNELRTVQPQKVHGIVEQKFLLQLFVIIHLVNNFAGVSAGKAMNFAKRKRVVRPEYDTIL